MLLYGSPEPLKVAQWMSKHHCLSYAGRHVICVACYALRRRFCSQAGVGFWITDPKQVRQLAEQLAKAQFAAKRDPHDCALIYIALGKKTLLQVNHCWTHELKRMLYTVLKDCQLLQVSCNLVGRSAKWGCRDLLYPRISWCFPASYRAGIGQLCTSHLALLYTSLDIGMLKGSMGAMQGLFRSAQHKKQAEFLGRSFDSDKDKAAAAKNAFVLLAQHRPQLAAAFFILGAPSLAVSYPGLDVPAS